MNSRSRSRRGMTLVELTVAIALAAMLLASLTGVLRGVSEQSKLADSFEGPVWPSEFLNILHRDLMAAEAIWAEQGVVLIKTDAPQYQSVGTGARTVGYACVDIGKNLAVLNRIDGATSVLAMGPRQLVIERLDTSGRPQPLPATPGPVPTQVRVWVWEADEKTPVILRDLVIR